MNVEDDLFTSGRLGAFARAMGLPEEHALGVLVMVWRETQHREMVVTSREKLCTAISLRVSDPDAVIAAMLKAQLLCVEGDSLCIVGNDKHVERLSSFRARGHLGGKKSASKRQATAELQGSNSEPSLLLTPYSGSEIQIRGKRASATPQEEFSVEGEEALRQSEPKLPPPPVALRNFVWADLQRMRQAKRGIPPLPRPPLSELRAVDEIARTFGTNYQPILESYLDDDREYYCRVRWTAAALARDLTIHGDRQKPVKQAVKQVFKAFVPGVDDAQTQNLRSEGENAGI